MIKVYFGFDDTDTLDSLYGTGKLVRWFQSALPEGCECLGVVRQQLFVCDEIPYTSHNSAACLIAEIPEPDLVHGTIEGAVNHLTLYAMDGSDPGFGKLQSPDGYRCWQPYCGADLREKL